MQDHPVGDLYLLVRLRLCDRSTAVFNIELGADVLKLFIIKLSIIVGDDDLRKVESANYGFSYIW